MVAILLRGNKASGDAFRCLLERVLMWLERGFHLLLIDLYPQTRRDPAGIHGAVWSEYGEQPYTAPPEKPLTLAAYTGGALKKAYVEPIAAGDVLPNMPLFLDRDHYVPVPLEATYHAAARGIPERWRTV